MNNFTNQDLQKIFTLIRSSQPANFELAYQMLKQANSSNALKSFLFGLVCFYPVKIYRTKLGDILREKDPVVFDQAVDFEETYANTGGVDRYEHICSLEDASKFPFMDLTLVAPTMAIVIYAKDERFYPLLRYLLEREWLGGDWFERLFVRKRLTSFLLEFEYKEGRFFSIPVVSNTQLILDIPLLRFIPSKYWAAAKTADSVTLKGLKWEILPEDFYSLQHVQFLNLTDLTIDALNDRIGCFSNLEQLRIENCTIDTISDEIAKLEKLEYVCVSNTDLDEWPKAMPHLRKLVIRGCNCETGIEVHVPEIDVFIAAYTSISTVPSGVLEATKMQMLGLNGNRLRNAAFPSTIKGLETLVFLNLSDNELTHIPEFIGDLKNLKTLMLSGNDFSQHEDSLAVLAGLEQLEVLFLEKCGLTQLPAVLQQLPKLRNLYITNNPIEKPLTLEQLHSALRLLRIPKKAALGVSHKKMYPALKIVAQ